MYDDGSIGTRYKISTYLLMIGLKPGTPPRAPGIFEVNLGLSSVGTMVCAWAKEARKNRSTLDLTVVQAFPGQACHNVSGREGDREASGEMSWATRTAAEHGMSWGWGTG